MMFDKAQVVDRGGGATVFVAHIERVSRGAPRTFTVFDTRGGGQCSNITARSFLAAAKLWAETHTDDGRLSRLYINDGLVSSEAVEAFRDGLSLGHQIAWIEYA